MPSKYQIISELASQTARDITSKAERYTDFLVTAANNYKYSFKEQLLIHAQKRMPLLSPYLFAKKSRGT